ncbi:MAG: ribonuclease III [Sedimentisphaerales bacterium]|nr:ribonuclease III [Sedimentisphaerales bacterium]
MDQDSLHQIEQILDHAFADGALLTRAFTHSSAVDNRLDSNERLEFLGDAVLSVVICQALFEKFRDYPEGELTKMKSMLVSRGMCARVARRMELPQFLVVGKGMVSNKALPASLAAGLLEAVIAAIYLDGGFEAAGDFILRTFSSLVEQVDAEEAHGNYKSLLQQYAQEQFNVAPVYVLLDEKGPDHNKCFESAVVIDQQHFTSAWGANKKDAEQKAAYNALVELGVLQKAVPAGDAYKAG